MFTNTDHIDFVADNHLDDVALCGVHLKLVQPRLQLGESAVVANVVYENRPLRVPVIRGREGAEAFLAGSVPYRQFDGVAVDVDALCFKINADRERLFRIEVVFDEAQQDAVNIMQRLFCAGCKKVLEIIHLDLPTPLSPIMRIFRVVRTWSSILRKVRSGTVVVLGFN